MIKGLTMEQLNEGLLNGGVKGRIMNKREVEAMKNELKTIEKEVRVEMDSFRMVAQFMNGLTKEDVYSTVDTVEYMEADIVGVVGQDIEIVDTNEDSIDLMYGTSYVDSGIRYTDDIDLMYGTRLY